MPVLGKFLHRRPPVTHHIARRAALRVLLLCVMQSTCHAHSNSHVDVWIRAGKQLDVRVTLFLDQVLAGDDQVAARGRTHIAAEAVQAGLDRFQQRLLTQLMIHDSDGRPIAGRIVTPPRWKVPGHGVDLQADAGLRLTWRLTFPWATAHDALSIQHRFVQHADAAVKKRPVTSPLPAEVRLRLRCEHNGRRTGATINHHLPHRILLPIDSTVMAVDPSATAVAAQLLLLPQQLIQELTLPAVTAALAGGPLARQKDGTSGPLQIGRSEIRTTAARWARENCRLWIDNVRSEPLAVSVRLLSANNEPAEFETLDSLAGLRLGIRAVHRVHTLPTRVRVTWLRMPDAVRFIQIHTQTSSVAATQMCARRATGELTYTWPVNPSHAWNSVGRPRSPVDSEGLWLTPGVSRWRSRLAGLGLLVACGIFVLGWRNRRARQWSLLAGALLAGVVLFSQLQRPPPIPNREMAPATLRLLLSETYQALHLPSERERVGRLSQLLADDLVESVYEQLTANSPTGQEGPVVQIDDVQLLEWDAQSWVPGTSIQFDCRWQVQGQVSHWGHRHRRTLTLAGQIRVETREQRCEISEITLSSARYDKVSRQPNSVAETRSSAVNGG